LPASYPTTVAVLAANVDNTDVVYAADMNAVQDEIIAIETALGTNPHISTARSATYGSVDARMESLEGGVSYTGHTHDHGTLTGLADDDHSQYMLKSLGTGKGYLITFSAASTPLAIAPGANGTVLIADSTQAGGLRYGTVTVPTTAAFETSHTWAIAGAIAVPSGDTDFLIPMAIAEVTNVVTTLTRVRYKINSGTSVTFKMQVAGADATGFTGLSATTTIATTDPADVSLADLDQLVPVVTAVSGSPKNLQVTAFLKHTVTLT
jgi:hypothetical protein